MLTQVMPALARALGQTLSDRDIRALMQTLGNCNQPLQHRGPIAVDAGLPPGGGGGMYNANYYNFEDYSSIINNYEGDNVFNDVTNNVFNDNRDYRTIRMGDVIDNSITNNYTINYINNPPGQKGDPGEKGDQGDPGRDGLDGRDGSNGLSIVGPAGPPGQQGPPGRDGRDGQQGPAGPPGVTTVVFIGSPGVGFNSEEVEVVRDVRLVITAVEILEGVEVTCGDDGEISVEQTYGEIFIPSALEVRKVRISVLDKEDLPNPETPPIKPIF